MRISSVKEKENRPDQTLEILFKGSYGPRYGAHCKGVLDWGKDIGLNSSFNKEKQRFTIKQQGSVDGKLPGADFKDRGFLLKLTRQDCG